MTLLENRPWAQEISRLLNEETFFIENNPNGVVMVKPFLQHYEPMMIQNAKLFKKHQQMWQFLKEGRSISGMLEQVWDKRNGDPYVWLTFELPRGKFESRFDILSPQMLEFITKYQIAAVSFNCTLDELITEANRILNAKGTPFQSSNKFPYESKEFDEQPANDASDKPAQ